MDRTADGEPWATAGDVAVGGLGVVFELELWSSFPQAPSKPTAARAMIACATFFIGTHLSCCRWSGRLRRGAHRGCVPASGGRRRRRRRGTNDASAGGAGPTVGEFFVESVELEVLSVVDTVRGVGLAGGQEDHLVGGAVVQRAEAHRARQGQDVDGGPGEMFGAERGTGRVDREDLGQAATGRSGPEASTT